MGLCFSHGDAQWAYSGFLRFRGKLAKEIGISLGLMEGFSVGYKKDNFKTVNTIKHVLNSDVDTTFLPEKPLKWDKVKDDIVLLINHSDCDDGLTVEECKNVAPRLREIVADWRDNDFDKIEALELADGMDICVKENEPLEFY